MCGIVGAVSSSTSGFFQAHQSAFEGLLWADTLRGADSTGVFGVNRYGNVDYLKSKGDPSVLFRTPEWKEFNDDIYSQFHMVVGHNRKATRGATSDENAHPFVEDNTILVHNGTLYNHTSLTDKKVEVDSHAILHSIVERGIEKTIEELDGAFTLVWYHADDKKLHICRNDQRPLHIANTQGAWFFASEDKMLKWILDREDIKIVDMTNCKPGTLYTFDLDKKDTMWYRPIKLKKPIVTVTVTQQTKPPVILLPDNTTQGEENKTTEKKDESTSETGNVLYANTDFPIGTKILVCAKEVKKLKKPNGENTHIIIGNWYFDLSVSVRCLCTENALNSLDEHLTDNDTEPLFQSTISNVISNVTQRKIILGTTDPVNYVARYDMEGREIFADEFMFTDKTCSYCGRTIAFDELEKGLFKYTSPEDTETMCEHCYDKGLYL